MRIAKHHQHIAEMLLQHKPEKYIKFNQSEIKVLEKAEDILWRAVQLDKILNDEEINDIKLTWTFLHSLTTNKGYK